MDSMTGLIHERLCDPDFVAWVSPSFTTTTENDRFVAAIIMMGTLQKYFGYTFSTRCGIPSVTLRGERSDWQMLLDKLSKLDSFGEECGKWLQILHPVLSQFGQTFDEPASEETKRFWNSIVHRNQGSGRDYITGLITAFCFWDVEGVRLYADPSVNSPPRASFHILILGSDREDEGRSSQSARLDGIPNAIVDFEKIPAGYAKVPVKFDENGTIFDCMLVAGSVGTEWSCTDEPSRDGSVGDGLNTVQPNFGWWMYQQKSQEEIKVDRTSSEDSDESRNKAMRSRRLLYQNYGHGRGRGRGRGSSRGRGRYQGNS